VSERPELWFLHPFRLPSEHAHGIQILHTCAALADAGLRVRLYVKRNPELPVSDVAEALARYGLAPRPRLDVRFVPFRHKGLSGLWLRARIASARGRPVFYVRQLRLAPLAARRGPVVVELHALESGTARAVEAASAVVTITRALAERVQADLAPRAPVAVIPDAADPGVFRPPTRSGSPRVVYLGQLMPWKGVDLLVEALAHAPGVRALVIGGRSERDRRREELEGRARELGVADRIEWTGPLPQRAAWERLTRDDVGLVPTRGGGSQEISTSPLKLYEYRACGLPVVASNLPALAEAVADDVDGLLFRDGDARSLARALLRLTGDEALRRRLSAASRARAAGWSWDARARAIAEVVGPLAGAPPPPDQGPGGAAAAGPDAAPASTTPTTTVSPPAPGSLEASTFTTQSERRAT